ELSAGVEIESLGGGVSRRPGRKTPPLVGAGFEDESSGIVRAGLFAKAVALALQVFHEERKFDIGAIIVAGFGAEAKIAEGVAVAECPSSVAEGAHDQCDGRGGAAGSGGAEELERAGKVFRVKPAADEHHGRLDVLHVGRLRALPPEIIVV